jgi:DNA repair exonuclease SbcCD ATPase subunit
MATLKVRETQPVATQVSLLGTPQETIRFYLQQRYLSESAKKFLTELIAMQGEINRLRAEENDLAQERARLIEDDARVRQNMAVLRDTAGELELRKKYLQRLQESDTRLEKIRDESKTKATERAQKERELSKKVQEFKDE